MHSRENNHPHQDGQLPFFVYQPASGRAYYHGTAIWRGDDLSESMKALKGKLRGAKLAAAGKKRR